MLLISFFVAKPSPVCFNLVQMIPRKHPKPNVVVVVSVVGDLKNLKWIYIKLYITSMFF